MQANVTCGDTTIGYVALVTTDGGSYWNVSVGGPGSGTLCTCAEHGARLGQPAGWHGSGGGIPPTSVATPGKLQRGSCRSVINTTRFNPPFVRLRTPRSTLFPRAAR